MSTNNRNFYVGLNYMLASTTCLSLGVFFVRINIPYVNYFLLVFLRAFLPFLALGVFFLLKRHIKRKTPFKYYIFRALALMWSQYAIIYYLTKNSVLNATVLLNLTPILLPFLEKIFIKKPISISSSVGAVISFVGVLLIIKPGVNLFSLMTIFALTAPIGLATSQFIYGQTIKKKEEPLVSSFFLFLCCSIISFFPFIALPKTEPIFVQKPLVYLIFAILTFTIIGNQYFRGCAYKRVASPSILSPFFYFSIVISGFLDAIFFKKYPDLIGTIGIGLVILGGLAKIYLRRIILKRRGM